MQSSDLVEVLVDLIWFPMGRGIQEFFFFGRGFDKIWFELIELMQDMVLEVTLFALVFLCNISWDYQKINRIPKREDVTRKNKGRRWGEPTNSTIIVEKKFLIGWWATSRVSRTRTIQSTRDPMATAAWVMCPLLTTHARSPCLFLTLSLSPLQYYRLPPRKSRSTRELKRARDE